MAKTADQLPIGEDALRAALIEARAKLAGAQALIEHLRNRPIEAALRVR